MTTLKVLVTSSALLLSRDAIGRGAAARHTCRTRCACGRTRCACGCAGRTAGLWGADHSRGGKTGSGRRRGGSQENKVRDDVAVDSGGHTVMSQRLDGTQYASIRIAAGKARTALEFKRPTKALDDTIAAGGGLRLLSVGGVTAIEGGIPIVVDGKIVGSIGVSGVTAQQDAQIARAGAEAVK